MLHPNYLMESLNYWLKYVILWTVFVADLTKGSRGRQKDDIKTEKTDERFNYLAPFTFSPVISYYGFQHPVFVADHQMFENFEEADDEDEIQPANVRSLHERKTKNKDLKMTSPFRREVLLWPRPCGWEWDGNMYRWGPCNIFFGGPRFPW